MKARVFRDKKGKAIACILQTEDPNLVQADAEVEDQGEVVVLELRQRDLLDLDKLLKKMDK